LSPTLTDEQEQAVARRAEPLLLAAGAGSGKTSVLVERFVRAVREDGVAPAGILAITFTERAAGELRERVSERLLALGEREAAHDAAAAFVSTFHGFCARLLRGHALLAGLDPEFRILDEGVAARLRERAFGAALQSFLGGERTEALDLLAAYGVDRVRSMVQGVYAELRSRGERHPGLPVAAPGRRAGAIRGERRSTMPAAGPDLPEESADEAGARACALLGELLEGFGRAYDGLKRDRAAVDFDDLELCAGELLAERRSVRAAWSQRFELLMVDEFQDTNPRQLAILTALDRGNLFTVGDELQSIYAFRHADVNLFRSRRARLAERGASLQLKGNFRSRSAILEVVNAVFESRIGDGYMPLLSAVPPRSDGEHPANARGLRGDPDAPEPLVELLLTSRRGWEERELPRAGSPGTPPWRAAEARMLAQRVAELVQSGRARPSEVVVLLRAIGDLEVYDRALQERGLPTLAATGGFWGDQQVGDLLAYLRAIANPLDEPALYGTLASPLVGCSSAGLALLARAADAAKDGLWETLSRLGADVDHDALLDLLSARDRRILVRSRGRLLSERQAAPRRSISQLIERALAASGYREHVRGLDGRERRLANVHKLLHLARQFEATEGRDLRGFLDYTTHQQGAPGGEPDAALSDGEPDAVRLMSVHAAKGLEFPVVCVADLGRAQNTMVPDLLVDPDGAVAGNERCGRIGLRLLRLDGTDPSPSLDFEELCEERKRAQAEEEERILYVAMTRARERLLLSGAVELERWPQARVGAPVISWLGPALNGELPAIVRKARRPTRDVAVRTSARTRVRCWLNAPQTGALAESWGECRGIVAAGSSPSPIDAGAPRGGSRAPIEVGASRGSSPSPIDAGAPRGRSPSPIEAGASSGGSPSPIDAGTPRDGSPSPLRSARSAQQDPGAAVDNYAAFPIDTLSYTAFGELERCGYRYYLERILGLKERRPPISMRSSEHANEAGDHLVEPAVDARTRGTLVHRLLESTDFGSSTAPSPQEVATIARELGVRVPRGVREEIAGLVAIASGGSRLAARVAAAESVHREHPFAFSLGPGRPLLIGVIDLLARERGERVLILDYKTDRVALGDDLEALVEREYGVQRLLYALAALRDDAREVEVVHWFLQRPDEWVAARFSAGEQGEMQERLSLRVERSLAHGFRVSERPHRGLCESCPGRAGLCSYTAAETLRERP
jgi:ATP-dependent exoDNAse (exonuclease V) beta subunit